MILLHGVYGEALCVRLDGDGDLSTPASWATHLAIELHVPGAMVELTLGPEAARELLAGLPPLVAALGRSMTVPERSGAILRPPPVRADDS